MSETARMPYDEVAKLWHEAVAEVETLRAKVKALEADKERQRALFEHVAQLLYDSEGNPIDGWEDITEIHDAMPGHVPTASDINRTLDEAIDAAKVKT